MEYVTGCKSMLIDPKIDGHVHTRLCHHASGEMEEYVQAAVNRGLHGIVFLEHLETGISYFESTWLNDGDFDYYFREGRRLQEKYRGRIGIELGVEVGYNPATRDRILDAIGKRTFDRIGISYHFLSENGSHLNMFSRKQRNIDAIREAGLDRVINGYLEGLLEAVSVLPGGSVLCHLDAVARHHPGVAITGRHRQKYEEILATAGRRGMAIEVNTSGYAHRNEPYPCMELLLEAARRRLPLIAGSDAHRPDDVGRYFDLLPELSDRLAGVA